MSQMQSMESAKGLPALRAKPEPTEADLRQNLAASIESRKAADVKAAKAKGDLERCAAMLSAAESEAGALEAKIAKAERRASERDAAGIIAAIKTGAPLPMTAMPEISTAELDRLKVKAATIRAAHAQFQSEWQEANAAVGTAAAEVAARADAVVECEARRLVAKRITLAEMCNDADDCLHGLFRLARQHPNDPRLENLANLEFELGKKLNRRGVAITENRQFVELPNYEDYIAGLQTAQQGRWAAYRLALMRDADASPNSPLSNRSAA